MHRFKLRNCGIAHGVRRLVPLASSMLPSNRCSPRYAYGRPSCCSLRSCLVACQTRQPQYYQPFSPAWRRRGSGTNGCDRSNISPAPQIKRFDSSKTLPPLNVQASNISDFPQRRDLLGICDATTTKGCHFCSSADQGATRSEPCAASSVTMPFSAPRIALLAFPNRVPIALLRAPPTPWR